MPVTLVLASAIPERPTLVEILGFQLNGLIVVFIALTMIWGVVELMGLFFRRRAVSSALPIPPPVATAAPVTAPAVVEPLPPELVAAITVAVHVTLGAHARVQAIVPVPTTQAWAHEGRRQIFSSHQPR